MAGLAKRGKYVCGWCAGADDPRSSESLRGANGHRRCVSEKCNCPHRAMNKITETKDTP